MKLVTLFLVAFLFLASPARAQQYVLGGSAQLASGFVGGASAGAKPELARTRIRIAVDAKVDEFPKDIVAIGMVMEVEPKASFGLDLRYVRRLSPKVDLNVGGLGYVYPESLIGPSAGANYHVVLSHGVDLLVGPELNFFIIGTDLPSGTVIWQGLLQIGIHLDL